MRSGWARSIVAAGLAATCLALTGPRTFAGSMYAVTDLGTLPGTTRSIATGINSQGQVVGVSDSGGDAAWKAYGVLMPLGVAYDAGAKSFLSTGGGMTQISPTGGWPTRSTTPGRSSAGSTRRSTARGSTSGGPARRSPARTRPRASIISRGTTYSSAEATGFAPQIPSKPNAGFGIPI